MDRGELKVAPGSALHRFLRITPGYAPLWLCSGESCTGIDVLTVVAGLLVGCGVVLGLIGIHSWWWRIIGVVLGVLLLFGLHMPFGNRERCGRARRRRGECVWCGQAGVTSGRTCEACGRVS